MVGELTMPGNGFRLPVLQHLAGKLGAYVGQHVVLGIRPEHFHLHPTGGEGDCCPVSVRLNVIEPLGNDMDIYMKTPLHDHVVGRVEAQMGLEMNTQATVYVDLRKVHFFEPGATGMNLSLVATEPAHAVA
jgi:multiple sugar transport system ATP-binding protein